MNSTQSPQNTPATQQPAELKGSDVAGWFTAFAAISFIAAGLAIYLLSSDNRIDNQQRAVLLPAGISGGLFCLAVAKIIRFLHESSQRLQRIEKLLERR
jgi:ABC-type Fe3+-siderophore transport system permease subunit